MKLYHYSDTHYDVLLTRRMTGQAAPEGVKVSDDYLDHISFFFDPIPSKILPEVFSKGHPFWYTGHRIYEHIIDVNELEDGIRFHVVESLMKTKLLDEFSEEHNWVDDDPILLRKWENLIAGETLKAGEAGRSRTRLKIQISKNTGITASCFIAASQRDDFHYGYNKYAANVPHLMLYPEGGKIIVREVNELKIGSDFRKKVFP